MNFQYRAALKSGTYFQVPLCAFAFGSTIQERLSAIISFGLVQAGEKWWRRATDDQHQERLRTWIKAKPTPDFKRYVNRHLYAARGCEITNVTMHSIDARLAEHDALKEFSEDFSARHGTDPLVRLKSSFIFEVRDGNGVTARELSVLAAIYSVIGNKNGPVMITQNRIRCRALGYKSAAVMQVELTKRKDTAKPLTEWELRSTLEKLTVRRFFVRSTYGCRHTYYSHRMTQDQLRKAIIERKTFAFANKLIRRHEDNAMTAAIHNQRSFLQGKDPVSPDARPLSVRGTPSLENQDCPF